jgi:predicted MFS family arabinose efflux permease
MPLGVWLEDRTSWRATFLIWSGLGAAVLVAVALLVPRLPSDNVVAAREVFRLPVTNLRLRVVMTVVTLFVLGHFGAFTFVRPFLEHGSSDGSGSVTAMLMIYGAGGAAGNFIAGHTAQRRLHGTYYAACGLLIVSLLLLLIVGPARPAQVTLLALWGLSFGAWQLCQVQMTLGAAPETFEAAMSLNTMAYNTSIALGALFGGLFADGLGVRSALWFGVVLASASVLTAAATGRRGRPSAASSEGATPGATSGEQAALAAGPREP